MRAIKTSPEVRRTALVTMALAVLWIVLAFSRDDVTYHLAPLIVAAVPPAGLGMESKGTLRSLVIGGMGGAALALAVTFLLAALGRLTGPSLLPFGAAAAESVIFSFAGAIVGLLVGGRALRAD